MDDDKPFVCIEHGCGQRFTNEDHLSVHMRKHEMSLALNPGISLSSTGISPSRMGGLILDQTPTPTKFLKNCEEIGLFQELNKNPFEEAFKKALDNDGDQGVPRGIPLPGPSGNDNELNTPVPHIPRSLSEISPLTKIRRSTTEKLSLKPEPKTPDEDQEIIVTDKEVCFVTPFSRSQVVMSTTTLITAAHSTTQSPPKTTVAQLSMMPVVQQSQCTMQIFLQLPNGTTVPVQIPASIPSVPVIQAAQQQAKSNVISQTSLLQSPPQQSIASPQKSQTSLTKQKLKQAIQQQTLPSPSSRSNTQIIQVSPDGSISSSSSFAANISHNSPLSMEQSFLSDTASSPDTVDSTQGTSFSNKRMRGDDDDDPMDGRRKKFLERNRAAAARCRMKRKNWIMNLEKRGSDLQQNNNKLQGEITSLRTEVAQLKTLLLAHKDCPVTHAMQKQGLQFMTESEVVDDTPINLKQENNTAVTSFTHILPDQTYSTLSTIASSSGREL